MSRTKAIGWDEIRVGIFNLFGNIEIRLRGEKIAALVEFKVVELRQILTRVANNLRPTAY